MREDLYLPIGQRIRAARRQRGLSQAVLAGLVDRSENWLGKVERGEIPVDRLSVLVRVAAVLRVPLATLLGDPSMSDRPRRTSEAVTELRRVVSGVGFAYPVSDAPRGLAELRADVDAALRLLRDASYPALTAALPGLLGDLSTAAAAYDGYDQRAAYASLSEGYQIAATVLSKLDQDDLALTTAHLGVFAADRAETELGRAAAAWELCMVLVSAGQLDEAIGLAERAAASLGGAPTERALVGTFYLTAALAAGRGGKADTARAALEEAGGLARSMAPDYLEPWTQFGPAGVAGFKVSTLVELGEAGEALDAVQPHEVGALTPNRRARYLIDLAVAYKQRRRDGQAVASLLAAERLAREELVSYSLVGELIRSLMRRGRERPDLRALAGRVGVT